MLFASRQLLLAAVGLVRLWHPPSMEGASGLCRNRCLLFASSPRETGSRTRPPAGVGASTHPCFGLAREREVCLRWPIAAGMVALVGMIKINCGLVIALPLLCASCFESTRAGFCKIAIGFPTTSRCNSLVLETNGAVILVPIFGIGYLSARSSWLSGCPFSRSLAEHSWHVGLVPYSLCSGARHSALVLSGAVVAMLAVLWAMVQGSSPKELWHGLVAQHQSFAATFFHPLPWNGGTLVFASLGLGALHPRWSEKRPRILFVLVGLAILGTTLLTVRDLSHSLDHGLKPRGAEGWLVSMGPALAPWLFVAVLRITRCVSFSRFGFA